VIHGNNKVELIIAVRQCGKVDGRERVVIIKPFLIFGAGSIILKDTEEGMIYGAEPTIPKDYDIFERFGIGRDKS
jgi:hypothetical protein